MTADIRPVRRALLSVSEKTGLVDFARALHEKGVELLSTGGTARVLKEEGLPVNDVASLTGFPEIMDGRVKTLHPAVHGGLLAVRNNTNHQEAMKANGIVPIDLLVVNLYPFEETLAQGASFDACIENIDIGGPAMIRAAAKNHADVTVVVDFPDYERVLDEMEKTQGTTLETRRILAQKAYTRTAAYDSAVSRWLATQTGENLQSHTTQTHTVLGGSLKQTLRYGENPHQSAGFYVTGDPRPGVASARQIQGKELSYNNIHDTDAAFELVCEFDPSGGPAVVIVKHANPCAVATGDSLAGAYKKALKCDPVSAFGGVIALNQRIDGETAEEIVKIFTEVVIAPDADEEARRILGAKKNLRLLLAGGLADPRAPGICVKTVAGGFLLQSRDSGVIDDSSLEVVTRRQPSARELDDLAFAFRVCKHVKSNAVVYAKDGATVGVGAGQMSRVDSVRIAARKSEDAAKAAGETTALTKNSVVASDAFFPFADGLLSAAEAGATAIIQPGGSMRDDEVIAAADEYNLAMIMTGLRHFRH